MRDNNRRVFFDAEHFFDGYFDNKDYALEVLRTAARAGAEVIVLCDTNGGAPPDKIGGIVRDISQKISVKLGIHCHNDTGLSAASTIEAVKNGASHIQGTINGLGERCGNADLCALIANLQLKLNYDCVPPGKLKSLTRLARLVAEIANVAFNESAPFVGGHAFTHKAGMHIDAVNKLPESFEHIRPELVGNSRSTLVSEIAGRAALLNRMKLFAPDIDKNAPELKQVLELVKSRESEGYQFESAEGSLDLIILESLKRRGDFFAVETVKINCAEPLKAGKSSAEIKISVGGKKGALVKAGGNGPVNALDLALRKALARFYPKLKSMKLTDYKVRVLDSNAATAAKVRVLIESAGDGRVWRTVGVSADIIGASWQALLDSLEYKLSLDAGLLG
jgi:2-isopropylmalate synthase